MMNDILKFKIAVLNNHVWRIYNIQSIDLMKMIVSYVEQDYIIYKSIVDNDVILLPFTGVSDNNNREVYLGDIYRIWWYPDYKDYAIEFEGGGFFLGDDLLLDVKWGDYEYIGNKYGNSFT